MLTLHNLSVAHVFSLFAKFYIVLYTGFGLLTVRLYHPTYTRETPVMFCKLDEKTYKSEFEVTHLYIFTNPSTRAGCDTRSIFKLSLTGFDSEFSFSWTSCLTKAEEPSMSYYLPIARGRIIGLIPFPRVLVLCEMQSVTFICPYDTSKHKKLSKLLHIRYFLNS